MWSSPMCFEKSSWIFLIHLLSTPPSLKRSTVLALWLTKVYYSHELWSGFARLVLILKYSMSGGASGKESESRSVESDSLRPHGLYSPWNSPGQNIGVGSLSFLQAIFPTQGSNPGLLHCRWITYCLSYQQYKHVICSMEVHMKKIT